MANIESWNANVPILGKLGSATGSPIVQAYDIQTGEDGERLDERLIKLKEGVDASGRSAYEIAVDNGFKGTEVEWLASLKGERGSNGSDYRSITQNTGNLFNIDNPDIIPGAYLNGGLLSENEEYCISHEIPVSNGETFTVKSNGMPVGGTFGDESLLRVGCVYDTDGTLVHKIDIVWDGSNDTISFTIENENASFIKVNVPVGELDTFMVVKGTEYPSEYIPFGMSLTEDFGLNERQKEEVRESIANADIPITDAEVVQTTGASTTAVMSQKAATDALGKIALGASELTWAQGSITGNYTDDQASRIRALEYIPIGKNKKVKITTKTGYDVVCLSYDKEKEYLATTGWANGAGVDTTLGDDACYVRIVVRHINNTAITPDEDAGVVFMTGSVYGDLFYATIQNSTMTINANELEWEQGTLYESAVVGADTRRISSEWIFVGNDKRVKIATNEGYDVSCLAYDKNKKYIYETGWKYGAGLDTECPEDAYYIRIVVRHLDNSDITPDADSGLILTVGVAYANTLPIGTAELLKLFVVPMTDFITIDTINNTITIPADTEFLAVGMRKILAETLTLTLSDVSDTSLSTVIYRKSTDSFEVVKGYKFTTIDANDCYYVFSVRDGGSVSKPCADIGTPYYIDGILYGGAEDTTDTSLDATKVKEFANLFYNTDKVESFLFFTDPHLCQSEGDGWREEFDAYMDTLKKFYNESAVSRVFCGGDWLGGSISSASDACYRLGLADAKMREYFAEYHAILGNHESNVDAHGPSNPLLSRETIRNLMFRKEGNTYYSVEGENTKFFIFNTQDEAGDGYDEAFSTEQVEWFANALKSNTAENIALMLHIVYYPYNSETLRTFTSTVLSIAQAFNNKTSITVSGSTYDFTNATGTVRFLMGGHSHLDTTATHNGIPVILTTHLRDGSTPTFDLCLVNYDTNTLHLVRVGTGENRTVSI